MMNILATTPSIESNFVHLNTGDCANRLLNWLTDLKSGCFGTFENGEANWWVLIPLFEDQSEKSINISFQETALKAIHFTCIYDDYQVKYLFEIPPNHTSGGHSVCANVVAQPTVSEYENAWNLHTF